MTAVYDAYDNELMYEFETREEAEQWIGNCAYEWNYGLFSEWKTNGKHFYDVGPRVFYIKEE